MILCTCPICGPVSEDPPLATQEDGLCDSCRAIGHGRACIQFLWGVKRVPQLTAGGVA